ncbi:bifunctional riboflavin kinase/FAD synthetase [Zavarzinella formosa]|uniref:bifunctional riboflavin kinase/FAD synthetase n=1 Tax=Zavarzinella formosa TaxID=360055 RepID=UPI0003148413|nr:bifunctional riboflavin kinase/FAD synthetase [Zavarzinella formosa]
MAVATLRYHETPPPEFRGGVVTVGNFDGVHEGHKALIAAAREMAGAGGKVVPVTFDPHPLQVLTPAKYQPPLTTVAERAKLLHGIGADHVVVLQTTPELLALSAEYFFETIIQQALDARGMAEGFNFHFGKDREGDNALLRLLGGATGIPFREAPAFELNGETVSSSRVREALMAGDLERATNLLGRRHRISGTVVEGAKRGRTLGWPTANLGNVATLLPVNGVYAVRVWLDGKPQMGAANIGPNPTFGQNARKVEVHVINFTGDLYGQTMDVDFVGRLRATQKFSSVDALLGQMTLDIQRAKVLLSAENQ